MNLEHKIEAILFFKNEPVSLKELSKSLGKSAEEISAAIKELHNVYRERGIVVISNGEEVSFGTNPALSRLIEDLQKEELSREIGRAGIETLSIILYKGPVSRREIDYIRGVNSGFILRTLLIRGLIERTESKSGERSFSYKTTLKLLEYLGISHKEELPDYHSAIKKIDEFAISQKSNDEES